MVRKWGSDVNFKKSVACFSIESIHIEKKSNKILFLFPCLVETSKEFCKADLSLRHLESCFSGIDINETDEEEKEGTDFRN